MRAPQAIVGANEGRGHYWGQKGDRFYRKTKGKSLMLSGFICPCHGRMEMSADQVPAFEAFVAEKHPDIVFTGKSKFDDDGYGKGYAPPPHTPAPSHKVPAWPCWAATWRGVAPFLLAWLGCTPGLAGSSAATPACPSWAAMKRGVVPFSLARLGRPLQFFFHCCRAVNSVERRGLTRLRCSVVLRPTGTALSRT